MEEESREGGKKKSPRFSSYYWLTTYNLTGFAKTMGIETEQPQEGGREGKRELSFPYARASFV